MAKLPNLQAIRDTVRGNIAAANLAKQSGGNAQELHNGIAIVPEGTMLRLLQWLHEIILPKIAATRGADSEEYTNFESVRDGIIWSLYLAGQCEKLMMKNQREKQLLGYYIQQNAFLERELQKYTTVEQLITNETADIYRQSIISKAIEVLNQKK